MKKYNYIDYSAIIGFEDSYKGITAMSSVIYNTIFVNNNTYYYFNFLSFSNEVSSSWAS